MKQSGCIAYAQVAANSYIWANYIFCASDETGQAYLICICGCQWQRLVRLFFWEVSLVQQGGPMAYAHVAANSYT